MPTTEAPELTLEDQITVPQNPLIICAKGQSRHRGLELADRWGCDLWTLNDMATTLTTLHWQIHRPCTTHDSIALRRCHDTIRMLGDTPVVCLEPLPYAKRPLIWPHEKYRAFYGFDTPGMAIDDKQVIRDYLSNSVCYMLAYGVMAACGGVYDKIYLYGAEVHPAFREESESEHPCLAFYVGWARARGIRVAWGQSSHLLSTGPHNWRGRYGDEVPPVYTKADMDLWAQARSGIPPDRRGQWVEAQFEKEWKEQHERDNSHT